jgi:inosine-uridine nucleoside N-ribohydrolase
MTNLALAINIDPHVPNLAKELVFMGGSLAPETDNPEFATNPRHEFNFWFDPEAAHAVLSASWKKILCIPTDVSVKTHLSSAMVKQIEASGTPLARYIAQFFHPGRGAENFLWDELAAAAWIDPTLITRRQTLYMDVDVDRGASYGNTLTWSDRDKPAHSGPPVEVEMDLDKERFYRTFVSFMSSPTPSPH